VQPKRNVQQMSNLRRGSEDDETLINELGKRFEVLRSKLDKHWACAPELQSIAEEKIHIAEIDLIELEIAEVGRILSTAAASSETTLLVKARYLLFLIIPEEDVLTNVTMSFCEDVKAFLDRSPP
jgi:hypothetical protein